MVMRYFRADVEPRGQGRPRFRTIPVTQNGKRTTMVTTYKAKEDKEYEKQILDAYKYTYHGIKPMEGPLDVSIRVWMPIPVSVSRKMAMAMALGSILPEKKPDIDNVAKAVLDALNGVAWADDKQICGLNVCKRYETGEMARGIEVYIREIEVGKHETG